MLAVRPRGRNRDQRQNQSRNQKQNDHGSPHKKYKRSHRNFIMSTAKDRCRPSSCKLFGAPAGLSSRAPAWNSTVADPTVCVLLNPTRWNCCTHAALIEKEANEYGNCRTRMALACTEASHRLLSFCRIRPYISAK
jgi:hypothetical protein